MENYIKIALILFLQITFLNTFSQEKDCKVLGKDMIGEYQGKCKKGLAHGSGIFKFTKKNEVYEGKFKKGKFHGEGELYSISNREKTILKTGIWKDNQYQGEKKIKPYDVYRANLINLDRYIIRKVADGNSVTFNFYRNGTRNDVRDLNIFVNNGNRVAGSNLVIYDSILYPFTCQVTYNTPSKLGTTSYRVNFEFTLNEPGVWEITLFN